MSRQKPLSASSRAKNSLRPFFNSRKERSFWKEIQTVRQDAGRNDYPMLCAIIESNRAYPFPGLGNTFPTQETKIPNPDFGLLKPLHLSSELALQIARPNHHAIKLNSALISLADINHNLVHQRFAEADAALAKHNDAYGLSLIVLKKDLLIALERDDLPGLSKRYKNLMGECQNTAWALLARYLYDLIDPTYDPTRAMRRWLRLADGRVELHPWYARILQDDILIRSSTPAAFSSSLLRFSALSLLDLAILIWRKKNAHPGDEQIQTAFASLDNGVRTTLEEKFSTQPINVSQAYNRSGRSLPDVEIYRTSFCFDDIASVVAWRCQINRMIFAERPDEFSPRDDAGTQQLEEAANQIAKTPKKVKEIISPLERWEKAFLSKQTQLGDQKFLSATLVAESARRIARESNNESSAITHLLATTDDIQLFVSSETFKALIDSEIGHQSPLLTFVLWEMIYRQARTQDNELDRRLAFMRLFKNNPNLIEVLDEVAESSRATAALLARTCSRTFLERLFMMMSSVKDVLATRLSVCRWLIDQDDPASDNLQEECDALVRELANLEARSDLDSTRVHVDEESLREWFESLHSASVTRYKQTVLAEGSSATFGTLLTFFSNKEKPDPKVDDFTTETQIGSEFLLVAIVDATLKSFVSDRTFGLDAYLSRRIRHGTLNGHVMTPITRVLGQLAELVELQHRVHDSSEHSNVKRFSDDWRKFLISELDHTRKDIIQIRSADHPKGLIQAQWRTASNIQHLDAMIARVRSRVIESQGAYDVFPDIYSFCWDCLESDLAQLRLFMLREFAPSAIRKLGELFEPLSDDERKWVFPYMHEARQVLEARIQEVCGWFIRPVFRRDRYNLKMLISTTFSIVRELDYDYAFSEEVIVSDEISLNRGSFDVFGDALFVLLGNAARHGKRDGHIQVKANVLEQQSDVVRLDITSEAADIEQYKDSIARIETAFRKDQDAISRAAVQEGSSGLMKLAGLMRRIRSPNVTLSLVSDDDELKITFSITLPVEISVTRLRG